MTQETLLDGISRVEPRRRAPGFMFDRARLAGRVATHTTFNDQGIPTHHRVLRSPSPFIDETPPPPYRARIPTEPLLPLHMLPITPES